MSSWFSTLAQPAAVTPPGGPEPATEVKPWPPMPWKTPSDYDSRVRADYMKDVSRKWSSSPKSNGSSMSETWQSHPWLEVPSITLAGCQSGQDDSTVVILTVQSISTVRQRLPMFLIKTRIFCRLHHVRPPVPHILLLVAFLWDSKDAVVGFVVFTLCFVFALEVDYFDKNVKLYIQSVGFNRRARAMAHLKIWMV